mmetsp:Transcript_32289/g.54731  ORF Transcript_32289/g.54731 Transcript_32289/m.54731 type:complete len:116 (-) Transcript_32289:2-349(-)
MGRGERQLRANFLRMSVVGGRKCCHNSPIQTVSHKVYRAPHFESVVKGAVRCRRTVVGMWGLCQRSICSANQLQKLQGKKLFAFSDCSTNQKIWHGSRWKNANHRLFPTPIYLAM